MVRNVIAGMVLVLVTACSHRGPEPSTESAAPRNDPPHVVTRVEPRPGTLSVPDGLRLPSVPSVKAAPSWTDRLATMTADERKQLESLNAKYYGMLEFDSAEEQKALVAAGVPMPEEWLAASRLSDAELARLANARSAKGSLFFADRQLDRFVEAKQRLEGTGVDSDFDSAVINSRAQSMVFASQALAITRSPFAAYLYGRIGERTFGEQEYTAAAIAVAMALGDDRARGLARQFEEQRKWGHAPPLSYQGTSAIESMMWREVHRYRPL